MAGESVLLAIDAAGQALSSLGVSYALIGGAALPAWGRIRATADADILVALPWSKASYLRIVEGLRGAGFAHLERADRKHLEDKTVLHFWFPLREHGYSIRLDIIVAQGARYDEIIQRCSIRKIDGLTVRVASCEDLVLLKLAAGRPIDRADAGELLTINSSTIDRAYLEDRASELGLTNELREVLE
ncbi:MAG: hypothetical protein AB1486_32135 [Planctomycetota bacterium]